jgi:hypothetical protein
VSVVLEHVLGRTQYTSTSCNQQQPRSNSLTAKPANPLPADHHTVLGPCRVSCSALAFAPHQQGLVLAVACSRQQWAAGAGSGCVQLWEAAGKASACAQWTLVSKFEVRVSLLLCALLSKGAKRQSAPAMLIEQQRYRQAGS